MGPGEFSSPCDLALDRKSGRIFVTDADDARVQGFSSDGSTIAQLGRKGLAVGDFVDVRGIAVDGAGAVYVEDVGKSVIDKFSSDGVFLGQLKGPGNALDGHSEIAVDSQDHLFVSAQNEVFELLT
jgi:DNA-binding beta-propeller fold protein YncE